MRIFDSTFSDPRLSKPGEPPHTQPGIVGQTTLPGCADFFWTGSYPRPYSNDDIQRWRAMGRADVLRAIDFEGAAPRATHAEMERVIRGCSAGLRCCTFGAYFGQAQSRKRDGIRFTDGPSNYDRAAGRPWLVDMLLRRLDAQRAYIELLDTITVEVEVSGLQYAKDVYLPAWRTWHDCFALLFPDKPKLMWWGVEYEQVWPVETVDLYRKTAEDAGCDIVLWGNFADVRPTYERVLA